jgi:NleD-like pathogen effector protein (putative zinc metallopeptidase)
MASPNPDQFLHDPLPVDAINEQLLPLLGNNQKAVDDLTQTDQQIKYTNFGATNIWISFPGFFDWYQFLDSLPINASMAMRLAAYRKQKDDAQRRIAACLDRVHASLTGKVLFREIIRKDAKHLTITPLIRGNEGTQAVAETPADAGVDDDGTIGKGSNVTIFFADATSNQRGFASRNNIITQGFLPDELLFHEMVHAAGMLRGRVKNRPISVEAKQHSFLGDPGDTSDIYSNDSEGEFLAIAITNMYISEKGKGRPLRGTHRPGDTVLKNPNTFLKNYPGMHPPPRDIFDRFSGLQPELYRALLNLPNPPVWFNPAQQYQAWHY